MIFRNLKPRETALSSWEKDMKFQTIVTVANLAENLDSPNWFILDCRGGAVNDKSNFKQFLESHIPNAFHFCCIENYIPDFNSASNLTSDFADDAKIILESLAEIGFNDTSQIIIYDEHQSNFSDSIWLLLRSVGCQNVAVLQGGFASWKKENKPLTKGENSTDIELVASTLH